MAGPRSGTKPIPVALMAAFGIGATGFLAVALARPQWLSSAGEAGPSSAESAAAAVAAALAVLAAWPLAPPGPASRIGCAVVALFGYFSAMYLWGAAV
jgi:hypothetical protein